MRPSNDPVTISQLEEGHLLIVGQTRSGKTYRLRGAIEQLRRADRRVGAIDKLGNHWGLTRSADGSGPGLEFVRDGRWRATIAGNAAIAGDMGDFATPGPALADQWAKRVSGAPKLVAILLKRWPHMITRDALAADAGMSAAGGTFGTYLGRLRSKGLIEEQGKRLRLSPALMAPQ